MEKRRAHYVLSDVKAVVALRGMGAFSRTAIRGAEAMGLDASAALAVVLGLRPHMLYKSMTTHADHLKER